VYCINIYADNFYLSFNEPGLLILLPEESNFPENIKEDEPFPEFLTVKKRQSASF
jgi:hypothetical protein